jgi:hypothetical protein
MNNILDLIPQPICSDGKKEIVQNAKNQGWETNDELIPTFFKPIEPQLIDLFTQYPDQMKMDPPLNIPFQFSPTASLMKLPENYALLVRERTVIIVGHPRSL